MNDSPKKHPRVLLHACCGPCSLEPSRLLRERGETYDIFYSNSNIAPNDEYAHRLDTLREWADAESITVIEGARDHDQWISECKIPYDSGDISREQRCRRCYRLRFEDSAKFAAANGYGALSTTLSVSPYQYTSIIEEELERACSAHGIECVFEDFRPYYDVATKRSRDAGMYRQNYCGCELSFSEAEQEREERRIERQRLKTERRKNREQADAEERKRIEERKLERKRYDAERARRKAILKSLRSEKAE